ncbi:MAG: SUF system Fe-S cluster assembly protein [Kiloniellales bacterium]|nr:SUF system Fe-S cluster assembly protein [Kiloniellales bacterium]
MFPGYFGASPSETEGLTARAGTPLDPAASPVATREAVIDAVREVYDPEIPVNIYELGLIYDLQVEADGSVLVTMTLTAPACPVAGEMPQQVADAIAAVAGVGEVQVTLTWEPAWTKERMSEDARLALGFF